MKNLNEVFAIIVKGDSYYKNRIKQQSYETLSYKMHNVVGLFGNFEGDNVGTEKEIDDKMQAIHNEVNSENECSTYKYGDTQIEDDSVYYKKVSVQSIIDDTCNSDEDKETLLKALRLIELY